MARLGLYRRPYTPFCVVMIFIFILDCTSSDSDGYNFIEALNLSTTASSAAEVGTSAVATWTASQTLTTSGIRHQSSSYFPPSVLSLLNHPEIVSFELNLVRGSWSSAKWGRYPHNGGLASRQTGLSLRLGIRSPPSGTNTSHPSMPSVTSAQHRMRLLDGVIADIGVMGCSAMGGAPVSWNGVGGIGVQRSWYAYDCPPPPPPPGASRSPPPALHSCNRTSRSQADGEQRQHLSGLCLNLPAVSVCNEAVSAWQNLSPCRAEAGLAALMSPGRLLAGPWFALQVSGSVHGREADGSFAYDLKQRLSGIVRVDEAAGAVPGSTTLASLLGVPDHHHAQAIPACPLASSSTITIADAGGDTGLPWSGSGGSTTGSPALDAASKIAHAHTAGTAPAAAPDDDRLSTAGSDREVTACLSVQRLAYELEALGTATVICTLISTCSDGAANATGRRFGSLNATAAPRLDITVTQVLPWMFRRVPGSAKAWDQNGDAVHFTSTVLQHAVRRGQPEIATFSLSMPTAWRNQGANEPPGISVAPDASPALHSHGAEPDRYYLSYRLVSPLLHAEEYPADAHRGFDIPGARVTVCIAGDGGGGGTGDGSSQASCASLVTLPATLEIPSPDFSMPYNVMTLVATVLAFTLGTMINVAARKPRGKAR